MRKFVAHYLRFLAQYAALGTIVCLLAVGGYYGATWYVSHQWAQTKGAVKQTATDAKDAVVKTTKRGAEITVDTATKVVETTVDAAKKTTDKVGTVGSATWQYVRSWFVRAEQKKEDKKE